MIGIRQINRVYLTLCFLGVILFLSGLSYTPNASAWKNGRNFEGMKAHGFTPLYYGFDYLTMAGSHVYGTHDWIAESALQLLYEQCAANQQYGVFVQRLYGDLRYWYLLGSEIPDSRPKYDVDDGSFTQGYLVNIKTQCDNWVSNREIHNSDHSVSFTSIDPLRATKFRLQTGTIAATNLIQQGFMLRDCQWLAYYMGALTHFIADASYYPHVLRGWDGWEDSKRDPKFSLYVNMLTNTIYPNRLPTEFFNIDDARLKFDQSDMLAPSEAVYRTCVDTRYGNSQTLMNEIGGGWSTSEFLDATELHDIWVGNNPWPEDYEECETWTLATRIQLEALNTQNIYYFNTIEHDLNTAIYYLTCALNWLLFKYFTNCDCTGEVAADGMINEIYHEQADWLADEEGPWEAAWLAKYEMSNMISIFGLVMALISVSVVKKLELLLLA